MDKLFQTQRNYVLSQYEAANEPFVATTIPYHSTRPLIWDVVDVDQDQAGAEFAWLVAKPQTLSYFSYGEGDQIDLGGGNERATDAETNLAKAHSTNGAKDFVMEGFGLSCVGTRWILEAGALLTHIDANVGDRDVRDSVAGRVNFLDPAAALLPPQVYSPFNLENALFQGVVPGMGCTLEWDRTRTHRLGTVELFPQASGSSYLRAHGTPKPECRYHVPEGFLWRRDGEQDSEFELTLRLHKPVVCLAQLPTFVFAAAGTDVVVPTRVIQHVRVRAFGLTVDLPSRN